ncbi:hypothetical protein NE237_025616 [Protea cynaroides]|uniref:PH domain-containing protein n=1 Tax=Protea cynaroides TaxID=273540 RepID=A0A9Q0K1H7_9MAGN|nr:hypothetical protein NE237_025616 [Protea cynaroides]
MITVAKRALRVLDSLGRIETPSRQIHRNATACICVPVSSVALFIRISSWERMQESKLKAAVWASFVLSCGMPLSPSPGHELQFVHSGYKGMDSSSCRPKFLSSKLENIDEDGPASWIPAICCAPPETPTEPMEFLSRSWSLSAMELSKALANTPLQSYVMDAEVHNNNSTALFTADHVLKDSIIEQLNPQLSGGSPPVSPRGSDDAKELFLLHQALDPDLLSNQPLLKNGLCKNALRGKTAGTWLKDQKEKKKQELRIHNAQLHVAVSVAGVAAAIASLAASRAMSTSDTTSAATPFSKLQSSPSKTSAAVASAAALVASHCVELAEEMGADRDQILTVVDSAVNVRTAGDVMTLTAGAATALRGAAILRARQHKGLWATTLAPAEEQNVDGKDTDFSLALRFVSEGKELLKRTRKGALHWKQVYFYVNSSWQVIAKMKSKHMAGAYTKKKKCVVSDVYCDTPAWPEREGEDGNEQRTYFGIQTADRVIEFECRSKGDKQMWTDGIRLMLHSRTNMTRNGRSHGVRGVED